MIVLDIEMPKSCGECPMLCGLYEYDDKGYAKFSDTKRHPDCSLKKLSTPHGRLIDADKLADDLEWDANRAREMLDELDPLTAEYVQLRFERDTKQNAAWWIRNEADKNCLVPVEN